MNKPLTKFGLYSISAAHDSVPVAGGWSQAGGHAAFSSYDDLGADQILEFKVPLRSLIFLTALISLRWSRLMSNGPVLGFESWWCWNLGSCR